jgi:hypothetical protein
LNVTPVGPAVPSTGCTSPRKGRKNPTLLGCSGDGDLHIGLRRLDWVHAAAQSCEVGKEHVRLAVNAGDGSCDHRGSKYMDASIGSQAFQKFVLLIGSRALKILLEGRGVILPGAYLTIRIRFALSPRPVESSPVTTSLF